MVTPFKEEKRVQEEALKFKLYPSRLMHVKGHPSSEVKRSFMEFQFKKTDVLRSELTIEKSRHQYTEEYIQITRDFYLKM